MNISGPYGMQIAQLLSRLMKVVSKKKIAMIDSFLAIIIIPQIKQTQTNDHLVFVI